MVLSITKNDLDLLHMLVEQYLYSSDEALENPKYIEKLLDKIKKLERENK